MLDPNHKWNTYLTPPIVSFVVSVALTLVIYFIAVKNFLLPQHLDFILIGLAILQVAVQLVFFFQVGNESKPRWNLMTLLFTLMVVVIIIGGSMWIMNNLDYNLMPPGMKM